MKSNRGATTIAGIFDALIETIWLAIRGEGQP